jgi:holo-[acyl-carrier protein] synthase
VFQANYNLRSAGDAAGSRPLGARAGRRLERTVYLPEFDPERSGAVAVGVDVIEIARIQRALDDFGERFLRRVYTERERDRYRTRVSELAARFAAKEATSKALGTGIRGIRWREMEVLPNPRGKPVLILHGQAAARAAELGLTDFSVSLTHSRTDAMAFVVAVRARSVADAATVEPALAFAYDTRRDGSIS